MTPIRALLVDDEQTARANVRALLAGEPRWQVIGECEDAAGLRAAVATVVPDVVFLDIRLPGGDGVELARVLQQLAPRPLVVFITAYEHYAVSAFEVQAIDYLLKPFDDARFQIALRRAEEALGDPAAASRYARRLVIRSIGRVQFVEVAEIDWLEASGNYVEIHCNGQSFLHRERLRVLEQQLDPADFVRIHRSIIVHKRVVKELRPLAGGDYSVLVNGGTALRLSRTYRGALDQLAR